MFYYPHHLTDLLGSFERVSKRAVKEEVDDVVVIVGEVEAITGSIGTESCMASFKGFEGLELLHGVMSTKGHHLHRHGTILIIIIIIITIVTTNGEKGGTK